jgi:FtsZ-interacting cell division protein ZipA
MKKLLVILGILLLAGLAVACKKRQEEPLAPEVQLESTANPAVDEAMADDAVMEDEGLSLNGDQATEEEPAWDGETEQGETYPIPEWDLTEPESPEEAPADEQDLQEEQDYEEMTPEESGADMEEPPVDGERSF